MARNNRIYLENTKFWNVFHDIIIENRFPGVEKAMALSANMCNPVQSTSRVRSLHIVDCLCQAFALYSDYLLCISTAPDKCNKTGPHRSNCTAQQSAHCAFKLWSIIIVRYHKFGCISSLCIRGFEDKKCAI